MIKHYRKLLLLLVLVSLAACEAESTPSVLVDSDKISIEIRNTEGICSSLNDANALEISLFEGGNNLRLFGGDQLSLLIDGLPITIEEKTHNYFTGGDRYCYFVDLTDTGFNAYSLSTHRVELEYSRGTELSYSNTLVFPDVAMEVLNSSAAVQPFSAQLVLDDALATATFFSGQMQVTSVESDENGALCVFNNKIDKGDIRADDIIELNLNSLTQSCVTGSYSVSDDSEITLRYKYSINNIEGLESITTLVRSTIDWPFTHFTYNN